MIFHNNYNGDFWHFNLKFLLYIASKLEDVKIEHHEAMYDELDSFFSTKEVQKSEETNENEEDDDDNKITYLDDEEPDWK